MKKDRVLRSYERIAQKDYTCNYCGDTIKAGDEYRCIVEIKGGRFRVYKDHSSPDCPIILRDGEEMSREMQREEENERVQKGVTLTLLLLPSRMSNR